MFNMFNMFNIPRNVMKNPPTLVHRRNAAQFSNPSSMSRLEELLTTGRSGRGSQGGYSALRYNPRSNRNDLKMTWKWPECFPESRDSTPLIRADFWVGSNVGKVWNQLPSSVIKGNWNPKILELYSWKNLSEGNPTNAMVDPALENE